MTQPRPQKRIYLINRDFQLRYVLAAVVVGLLSTVLTTCLILIPLYVFEILRIPRFLPAPVLGIMLLAAVLNVMLIALLGVYITHRVAGPMYSLVRCFRRVEMGRWAGHLRIRNGDDLRFLVRNFNHLLDGLVRTCKTDLELVDNALAAVEKSPSATGQQAADSLQKLRDRYQRRMNDTDPPEP